MNRKYKYLLRILLLIPGLWNYQAFADGAVIDKIYHPYVDALENEIEYRSIFQDAQTNLQTPAQLHKLSFGTSLNEKLFGEVYLIGEKSRLGNFKIEAYEAELKWQLTEQGEYAVDWGLLFEYENEFGRDVQELALGLLAEKEWGRFSGAANFILISEWGDDIQDEVETSLGLQLRYRYSKYFEPAIELYKGQDTFGLGPTFQGSISLGNRKNLTWEAGLILGLDNNSPNQTGRFLIEYEF